MFDPAALALLAKLKVLAKKNGTNIDLIKMSEDKEYVLQTLKDMSNSDDPELVLVAIQLMNQFGMIKAPSVQTTTKEETDGNSTRYVGTLR